MPSTVSKQNNYYASHHRRQSSQSQTNLPDQIRTPPSQVQSPSRSLVFLPSTVYSQQPPQQRRNASFSIDSSEHGDSHPDGRSEDPHDFYRQYRDSFDNNSPGNLHQGALRATEVDGEAAKNRQRRKSSQTAVQRRNESIYNHPTSGSSRPLYVVTHQPHETSNADSQLPDNAVSGMLKSRKASFKDLVARFDASPEDIPPMPSQPGSRPGSTAASPLTYIAAQQFPAAPTSRRYSKQKSSHQITSPIPNDLSGIPKPSSVGTSIHSKSMSNPPMNITDSLATVPNGLQNSRRPLFGEILPNTSSKSSAGYGIVNARRRRGSEGSPMHSPNPMFPSTSQFSNTQISDNAAADWYKGADLSKYVSYESKEPVPPRPQHRRAQSDFAGTPSQKYPPNAATTSLSKAANTHNPYELLSARKRAGSSSRIPISVRRHSLTSESDQSTPSSRAASKLGLRQNLQVRAQPGANTMLNAEERQTKSHRRNLSPVQIKSPGRSGQAPGVRSGEKSPSLRANIIAPPPKISPPLRSSRPRVPISAATTAASRAKIAEKFTMMAKEQSNQKHSKRRPQPPELTDIDLKARRLRITQALSRSSDSQDLRGSLISRTSAISTASSVNLAGSEVGEFEDARDQAIAVPSLVVEHSAGPDDEDDVFATPDEQSVHDDIPLTQYALRAMEGQYSTYAEDMQTSMLTSPDHGRIGTPSAIQNHLHTSQADHDSSSAVTQGTTETPGTLIDAESQADESRLAPPNPTLLSQILGMRGYESASPSSGLSPSVGEGSDHADEESVQIILRNTTYLEDDEAVEKGYRGFTPAQQVEESHEEPSSDRDSWTSSIAPQSDTARDSVNESGRFPILRSVTHANEEDDVSQMRDLGHSPTTGEPLRSTMASDAYTIVNIVLQQRSDSGIVDQQIVDDIYQRIVHEEPELARTDSVDPQRIERLCLQELQDYSQSSNKSLSGPVFARLNHAASLLGPPIKTEVQDQTNTAHIDSDLSVAPTKDVVPPKPFQSHQHKSSLDSAEDWAHTSPSMSDWMRIGLNGNHDPDSRKQASALNHEIQQPGLMKSPDSLRSLRQIEQTAGQHGDFDLSTENDAPKPPSHSPPPPPPISKLFSLEKSTWSASTGVEPSFAQLPQISRRGTSISHNSSRPSADRSSITEETTAVGSSVHEQLTQDERRMKQRRHVLKELVDTEYTYERDLRVLCDIYMQTALAALPDDDVKVLFGNVEQVQQFAKDFLSFLKQVVKPAYIMERPDRKPDEGSSNRQSSSAPTSVRTSSPEMNDVDKDQMTRVGQAFLASMADMERVYTEYIRGRQAANKRLEALQTIPRVREWLKECSDNSSDITNAWSLDALLVKPVQRILKYPLLLNQLLESTNPDHPDREHIRTSIVEMTEVNMRINEVKKHTELVDQVLNRKRKESDVRNGLTKAFGRRAEKLRQHVGINEMYEDSEYARLKIDFDNNSVHLMIVSKDCQGYLDSMKAWVTRLCELAAAAEAWVDVGHSQHAEAESKLRQFTVVVRGVNSIALPDHIEKVLRRVIQPMERTNGLLERFKTDPKGLIQKREKKLIDYNQFKNKKDRGEKLDKKMTEKMEQWEALNVESKDRIKKLLSSTAKLVQYCQGNLLQLHLSWLAMCKQKFSAAMSIPLHRLDEQDIVREWQVDFDFQQASALALGICNGSLLSNAANMVNFLTPGSTLNDDESPRNSSWNSGAQRSVSLNSDNSQLPVVDYFQRYSEGLSSSQADQRIDGSSHAFSNGRVRAISAASGRMPRTPDSSHRYASLSAQPTMSTGLPRPGTSPGRSDTGSGQAPRLSIDAPSPSLGLLRPESPPSRPESTSTFFSAAPIPVASVEVPPSRSSLFSSAMPMSDSPMADRQPATILNSEPSVLFTAASVYEFNIDRSRQEAGFPYLTYVVGEIFDVMAERGELWLARNQDDPNNTVGWIWNKHFAKLAE